MIRPFLKGLPYTLTKPMFAEYEAKCAELRRWAANSRSRKMQRYLENADEIQYIFALGIYYRYIVAPFAGTTEFFDRIGGDADGGIKLGGRVLTADYRSTIRDAADKFRWIASDFGLSEAFFAQTDVKTIVFALVKLEERRQRGSQ